MKARVLIAATSIAVVLSASPALSQQKPDAGQGGQHDHSHDMGKPGAWTNFPLLLSRGSGRTAAVFRGVNINAGEVTAYSPNVAGDNAVQTLPAQEKGAKLKIGKNGGYYFATASESSGGWLVSASTVHYFSNPAPPPREMLGKQKSDLEIIPEPLPREHARYREGENWPFLVRFKGKPLPDTLITFVSEHGSKAHFTTDAEGIVNVSFPADFTFPEPSKGDKAGQHAGHHRPKAGFVLVAMHADEGTRYLSSFNYSYAPGAYRGKNLWAGVGFGVLGMVLAVPLLRRRKNNGSKGK
ncbi:MAG: DUF4198 domain-containing protein [Rhodospirillales bacterium]|nr:DUF4198 domain-containing protein [Rhodospirillales bacterium]